MKTTLQLFNTKTEKVKFATYDSFTDALIDYDGVFVSPSDVKRGDSIFIDDQEYKVDSVKHSKTDRHED